MYANCGIIKKILCIRSVFSIKPNNFVLYPKKSIKCTISGTSAVCGPIDERFYCHAIIGNEAEYVVAIYFMLRAEFVSQFLEFSTKEMTFNINFNRDEVSAYLMGK